MWKKIKNQNETFSSKNILFDTEINTQVIEEVSYKDKYPVISLTQHEVMEDSLLLIKDFKVLVFTNSIKSWKLLCGWTEQVFL